MLQEAGMHRWLMPSWYWRLPLEEASGGELREKKKELWGGPRKSRVIYVEAQDSKVSINDSWGETAREKLLQAHHPGQPRARVVEGTLHLCNVFANRKLCAHNPNQFLQSPVLF